MIMDGIKRFACRLTHCTLIAASLAMCTTASFADSYVVISNGTNGKIPFLLGIQGTEKAVFELEPYTQNRYSTADDDAVFEVSYDKSYEAGAQTQIYELVPGSSNTFTFDGRVIELVRIEQKVSIRPRTSTPPLPFIPSEISPAYARDRFEPIPPPMTIQPFLERRPSRIAPIPPQQTTPRERFTPERKVTVEVRVYKLWGVDPIYHSGIRIYNTTDDDINSTNGDIKEWSFWPTGKLWEGLVTGGEVYPDIPGATGGPIDIITRETSISGYRSAKNFDEVRRKWDRRNYRVLETNCNHFVNDVMLALGVGELPQRYLQSYGLRAPLAAVQGTVENFYNIGSGKKKILPSENEAKRILEDKARSIQKTFEKWGF